MKQIFLLFFLAVSLLKSNAQKGCVFDSNLSPSNINMPAQLKSNEKKTVIVTAENNGTCIWKKPDVTLRVKIYRGPSGAAGVQRDELVPVDPITADEGDLEPGRRTYFRYEIEGPDYLGEYIMEFTLQVKGKAFGDIERKTIKIVKAR